MPKKEPLYPHVPKSKKKAEPRLVPVQSFQSAARKSFLLWLDSGVIADAIIENLQEQGLSVTVENMKTVWLSFLENEMPSGLRSTIKYTL